MNLSLEKSCSAKKKVVEVTSDGGIDLQKDLVDESNSKEELDGSKVMVADQMISCGKYKSKL